MSRLGRIAIVLVVGCCSLSAQAKYGGGSGTPEDPYLIYDANHMQAIGADANDWDKHFKLMADIDLSYYDGKDGRPQFNMIGYYIYVPPVDDSSFAGVFDGNDHVISNFTYDSNEFKGSFIGLFGSVRGPDARIKNLGLIAPNVVLRKKYVIGSLVGYLIEGTITNCYAKDGDVMGTVQNSWTGGLVGYSSGIISDCYYIGDVNGFSYVGSLVGENWGSISNCYSTGDVSGDYCVGGLMGLSAESVIIDSYSAGSVTGDGPVGGLVGYSASMNVTNCYSTSSVTGTGWQVGGLVGRSKGDVIANSFSAGSVVGDTFVGGLVGCDEHTEIINCYSTGNVEGLERIGGLAGMNNGTITKSYSVGNVVGDANVGGLVGANGKTESSSCYVGVITNSYWDIETSGEPNMCGLQTDCSSGCSPNYGKTTAEMKQQSTFRGWDFLNVWGIGEKQTYPYLRRYLAGDINKDGIVDFKDFAFVALQWLEEYNAGNRAPEVVITYPEDGERLMVGGVPPQTLITAEAEDSDGTVVRVEFFDDEMKLGEDTDGSDGWSYLWTEYSLGWHTLTAVAWDEEGLPGTSAPVTVEVWMPDPPPP